MKAYPQTARQYERLRDRERVSDRREFPRWVRAHLGERVAVRFVRERGNYRRQTDARFVYGTLTLGSRDDQYGVEADGEHKDIYFRRITDIYLLDTPRVSGGAAH